MISWKEFSAQVKKKYPAYANVDDSKLAQAMVEKYPEYKDRVDFSGMQNSPSAQSQKPTRGQEFVKDLESNPVGNVALQLGRGIMQVPGVGKTLEVAGSIADYIGAAPMRAGIGQVIENTNNGASPMGSFSPINNAKVLGAALKQYVSNPFKPSTAPTGKELADKMGASGKNVSDYLPGLYSNTGDGWRLKRGSYLDPTAAEVLGTGIEVVDPTIAFGGAKLGKFGAEVAKAGMTGVKTGAVLGFAAAKGVTSPKVIGAKAAQKVANAAEQIKSSSGALLDPLAEAGKILTGAEVKVAPTFEKQLNVAKRNGINTENLNAAIKYGKESTLNKWEKGLAEGVGARADDIVGKNTQLHTEIKQALNNNINALAPNSPASKELVTETLRNDFIKNIDDKIKSVDATYDTPLKKYGDIQINTIQRRPLERVLKPLEVKFKDAIRRTPSEAGKYQGLLVKLNEFRNVSGDYNDLRKTMAELGSKAFKSDNLFDYNDLQDIYFGMRKTLYNAVPDKKLKSAINESNKYVSEILSARQRLKGTLGNSKISTNEAFDRIFKNGSSTEIAALKKIFTPEDLDSFKAIALRDALSPALRDVVQESGKELSSGYKSALTQLEKSKERYRELFKPGELKNIYDLIYLGDKAGAPYLSLSRTGSGMKASGLEWVMDKAGAAVRTVPDAITRRNLTAAEQQLRKRMPEAGAGPRADLKLSAGGNGQAQIISALSQAWNSPARRVTAQQVGRQMNLYNQNQDRGR